MENVIAIWLKLKILASSFTFLFLIHHFGYKSLCKLFPKKFCLFLFFSLPVYWFLNFFIWCIAMNFLFDYSGSDMELLKDSQQRDYVICLPFFF